MLTLNSYSSKLSAMTLTISSILMPLPSHANRAPTAPLKNTGAYSYVRTSDVNTRREMESEYDSMCRSHQMIIDLGRTCSKAFSFISDENIDLSEYSKVAEFESNVLDSLRAIRALEIHTKDMHVYFAERSEDKASKITEVRRDLAKARSALSNISLLIGQQVGDSNTFEGNVDPTMLTAVADKMSHGLSQV